MTCHNLIDGRCTHEAARRTVGDVPRPQDCDLCPYYDGPIRGLGDVAAIGIKVATLGAVKPCAGCQRRRAALNDLMPSS